MVCGTRGTRGRGKGRGALPDRANRKNVSTERDGRGRQIECTHIRMVFFDPIFFVFSLQKETRREAGVFFVSDRYEIALSDSVETISSRPFFFCWAEYRKVGAAVFNDFFVSVAGKHQIRSNPVCALQYNDCSFCRGPRIYSRFFERSFNLSEFPIYKRLINTLRRLSNKVHRTQLNPGIPVHILLGENEGRILILET